MVSDLEPEVVAERAEQIEDLWWQLTQSERDDRIVLGLTSYLDDSVSSDPKSPVVLIGGPAFSRIQWRHFSKHWDALMYRYRIPQPFHMVDFVRSYGKHCTLPNEMKFALFADVAALINRFKAYSISISVSQSEFEQRVSEDVRKTLIGPYAFIFFSVVLSNETLCDREQWNKVAYLIDEGSARPEQLYAAHTVVREIQRESGSGQLTGGIGFDSDDEVPALQAADAIAWSARRREIGGLTQEFEPLNELLKEPNHKHVPIVGTGIDIFANPINNWIKYKGKIPSLKDFMKR